MKEIVTLTGPTCSGKSSIERVLAEQFNAGRVISHTSREPRPGEQNGVDYYFVDPEFFPTTLRQQDDWVEFVSYLGNNYGIHRSEIQRLSELGFERAIIVCDADGAQQVSRACKKENLKHRGIFVDTPIRTCHKRILARFAIELETNANTDALIDTYTKRLLNLQVESDWKLRWGSCLEDWLVLITETDTVPPIAATQLAQRIIDGVVLKNAPSAKYNYI